MATPHVAGVAALVWAKYPSITNGDVRAKIEETADREGNMWSTYGIERVNALKAVRGD